MPRIWYQSFVDPAEQAPYIERLSARLNEIATSGVTVEVHGVSPPDRHFHVLTEFRCADQTIRAALKAEREGYDAFVIGHFPEHGLAEARGAVSIPVIGLGEATMLHACTLGRKIGLVTINPVFVPMHEEQIRRQGLEHRVVAVASIEADLARFMRAFNDDAEYRAMRDDFVARLRPMVVQGIEVLIPSGGMPMLLLSREKGFVIDGAVVLDGIATVLKAAEMAVALHEITGVAAARSGIYAHAPPGAIEDFLAPRR